MKMRLLPLCCLLVMLVGCGQKREDSPYGLYFPTGNGDFYGETIGREAYPLAEGKSVEAMGIIQTLLEGPTDSTLINPFPSGTKVIWLSWKEDGLLSVNLSEEYSGLTGIDLTLADYCIVRTVCQIDSIKKVEILSANEENQFRNHQILRPEDILQGL